MQHRNRWAETDVLAADAAQDAYPVLEVRHGMTLVHTASNTRGTVAGFSEGDRVALVDRWGTKQLFRALDGAFTHEGRRVALRSRAATDTASRRWTASGSVSAPETRASVATPSRIWVEGLHDAELVEKVWGDDLRAAAVVVEPMHGADDLVAAVERFHPGPERRLGVLLDHLVPGSKEARLAAAVDDQWVLVCGHPFVDVWAAVDPVVLGLTRWPEIAPGQPWKESVIDALGIRAAPGEFWGSLLDRIGSYRDLSTPLVQAVEQLIDFVAEPIN